MLRPFRAEPSPRAALHSDVFHLRR